MFKKSLFPLSISGYALVFLFLVASFFTGIGVYALNSIERARSDIHANNLIAANQEIEHAIELLTDSINRISKDISNWDEIFQQLGNTSYYSYWRKLRMLNSGILPEYIEAAEVFDTQGNALAILSESKFPARINVKSLTPLLYSRGNSESLIYYLPIKRDGDKAKLEGYLGVHLPLIKTLIKQFQFHYLDSSTIKISLPENTEIPLSRASSFISFKLKSSPEAETMMQIVKETVIQVATLVGILCLFFYFLMVFLLEKPLVEISAYIDKLRYSNPGALSGGINSFFPVAELEKVRTSLNQYHHKLEKAHEDLDDKNKELWKLAHHDSLTGMLNRRAFELEWSKAKQLLSHHRMGICLLLFDVNHFKAINDSYGHQVGDEVLIAISACIQQSMRKAEYLYRIGGDEFAAIIIGSNVEKELEVAKRCAEVIKNYDFSDLGIKEAVRISCGISHCQADELEKLDKLQWQADIAVYQAKRPGNTRPVLFSDDMADGTEAVFSNWMSNAVYDAVAHGTGIEIHYQPIVNSHSRETAYFEALLRIRHEGELIPPSHIFPVVTMRHMETEMDRAIIAKVLEDLKSQFIAEGCGISINLSAESVAHQDVIEWLIPLSEFTRRHTIVIEVTETSLITQLNTAVGNLKMLGELGFKVALDDFGSGYSSLRYLTSMPVDIVKFDISLIQGMMDERLAKMVGEMAGMLTGLGYNLVAEGIETEELLQKVMDAGFNFSQGYLFGAPARVKTLEKKPCQNLPV